MRNRWLRMILAVTLGLGMLSGAGIQAGTLDAPTTYVLTSAQKSQILNWLNGATQAELESAYLSSSAVTNTLKYRPFSTWDQMWVTASVGSNTTVQYALVRLGIYGPLNKTATTMELDATRRQAFVDYLNTATSSELTYLELSSSNAAKVIKMRPFRDFEHAWNVPSIGSNTYLKNALIARDLYTELYDLQAGRPPLRVRVGDRSKILSWIKNSTSTQVTNLGISATGATKIAAFKASPTTCTWKKVLMRLSDSDLKKIGMATGAVRYISGSTAIESISGIGAVYGAKLRAIKFLSQQQFLMGAVWPEWRSEIVAATQISDALIVKWAKRADLDRVSRVGEQYGDLLAYAGVETVPDLAAKDPVALRNAMIAANAQYNLVNTMPSQTTVSGWVAKARTLPKFLEF